MFRALVLALIPVASLATPLSAQSFADVRLGDGSLVRMQMVSPMVEVTTKYGRLTIPLEEIRRVDFGLHLPKGVAEKLDAAATKLASPSFREREEAAKTLQSLGELAMPTVLRLSRSTDLEVVSRSASVLLAMRDAQVLQRKEEDVIVTREFTAIGRIQGGGLRAKSEVFGDVLLPLASLRTMHVHDQAEREFSVAADKFGEAWYDTKIHVDGFVKLRIDADGQVDLWPMGPGQYMVSPKGFTTTGKGGDFMAGALVGRIGESGRAFLVGERFDGGGSEEGSLFLRIVQSPWNNVSSGNYKVRVRTETR